MSQQPTVADYIVRRLAREGITDCFGVAGDFAFNLCDAVARSESIRWIGCSNELDAAYVVDGYARVRGCSMLLTTYAVGELSALNGVMGAKAERSCVFYLVGVPTLRSQRVRQVIHHTFGDGEFGSGSRPDARATESCRISQRGEGPYGSQSGEGCDRSGHCDHEWSSHAGLLSRCPWLRARR